jgi:hypothetical protein
MAGLARIEASPREAGTLVLIVRRPDAGAREVLDVAELDPAGGLIGDRWSTGGGSAPDVETQITLMNARVIDLIAQDRSRWALAGDQLFVDLDLSRANAPAGTRLRIGSSVVEVTAKPHTGCSKFAARFGIDATKLVNSPLGRELQLRGINATVVQAGVIRTGDVVIRLKA